MLVGKTIGNTFIIEKELGSGAMGSVYLARYLEDDRLVALKIIAFGLLGSDTALARFEREAVILKQLKHPNIVRLFATGKWRGTPFIAMEYIEGESLDRIMARRDRFSWQELVDIGKQLCAALQHAHERGIIHRDLKPSNLMITDDGQLKLTDFGIAKDLDVTALTGANNTIGTAAYMSPEQCRGEKFLTGKSDLYSLGVVFFELLTGRKPFIAESSVDMFLMHVNDPPPRVRGQPGCLDIPQTLDTLVHQLMDKKPDHRPLDAAMVGRALEEIEQKETARLSRGEEVAKARLVDPVEMAPMNETDRETAKTIRAGVKKKRLKKRREVFYRQGWFVAAGSVLLVALMGLFAWNLLRPDSADEMLADIKNATAPEVRLQRAKRYLDVYGKKSDPALAEKTAWVKEIYWSAKVDSREKILLNRYRKATFREIVEEGDDPEAYKKTMSAFAAEDDGDLAGARADWKQLVDKYQEDANEDKALWGWIAAKRLTDLDQVEEHMKRIDRLITVAEENGADVKADDDNLARAIQAERLRRFGDPDRSREYWERLARDTKGKAELRSWHLLAVNKVRDLPANKRMSVDERKAMLKDRLDKAESKLATDDRLAIGLARQSCRDIRELYSDDKAFDEFVQKANMLLQKSPN